MVIFTQLMIAAGFIQVHVVNQIKQEVRSIEGDAVMKVAAEGTITPANAVMLINKFIDEEIASKNYRLQASKFTVNVQRIGGISDAELTYKDEFRVTMTYQQPELSVFFTDKRDFHFEMIGTMEPPPYDSET